MYSNIIDPKTNKSVSIRSKKGKRVLRKYLTQVIMSGGAASPPHHPLKSKQLIRSGRNLEKGGLNYRITVNRQMAPPRIPIILTLWGVLSL